MQELRERKRKKTLAVIAMLWALALAHSGCRKTEPSVSKVNNAPAKILPANTMQGLNGLADPVLSSI